MYCEYKTEIWKLKWLWCFYLTKYTIIESSTYTWDVSVKMVHRLTLKNVLLIKSNWQQTKIGYDKYKPQSLHSGEACIRSTMLTDISLNCYYCWLGVGVGVGLVSYEWYRLWATFLPKSKDFKSVQLIWGLSTSSLNPRIVQ